jgi:hypothetical protein
LRGGVVIEIGEWRHNQTSGDICIAKVDNAGNVYEEWKLKDIEFVGCFSESNYGSKVFSAKDNNGNMLLVGHALKKSVRTFTGGLTSMAAGE